ncbi:Tl [Trypoxylus dichotomus]
MPDGNSAYMQFNDNPFDCGCDVLPSVQYFEGSYSNKDIYQNLSLDPAIRCHSMPNLARRNVNSLKSQTFTCNDRENACPAECSCNLHPHNKSFNITCSNRNLTTPPTTPKFAPIKITQGFNRFLS